VTDPHKLPNAEFKILTKNSFEEDPEFRWYLQSALLLPARLWRSEEGCGRPVRLKPENMNSF